MQLYLIFHEEWCRYEYSNSYLLGIFSDFEKAENELSKLQSFHKDSIKDPSTSISGDMYYIRPIGSLNPTLVTELMFEEQAKEKEKEKEKIMDAKERQIKRPIPG